MKQIALGLVLICSVAARGQIAPQILYGGGGSIAASVATPTQTPDTGTYIGTQSVTIATSTGGSTLYYCTNASVDCSPVGGTTYSAPVSVASSGHLCSYATHSGMLDSGVKCSTYTLSAGLSLRGSSVPGISGSSASFTLTLPAGSAAGDFAVLVCASSVSCVQPTGWSTKASLSGGNINGSVFYKVLSSGDISTGTVTQTTSSAAQATADLVVFVGATGGIREAPQSQTVSSPITITTSSAVSSGDEAIYFAASRASPPISVNRGTQLRIANSSSDISMVLAAEAITSPGAMSAVFTNGYFLDFQTVVIVKP